MPSYTVRIKGIPYKVDVPEGASQEDIMQAVSEKHGAQVFGDTMIQQELTEQKRQAQDYNATRQFRERQDREVNKILDERNEKKTDAESSTLEKEIRRLWAQEGAISKDMAAAEAAKDKAAYDKAGKAAAPIGTRRDELLQKLRKVNPQKAEALFNELFDVKQ